jgi:hypothetical protein
MPSQASDDTVEVIWPRHDVDAGDGTVEVTWPRRDVDAE